MNFFTNIILLSILFYGPFCFANIDADKEAYFMGDYQKAHSEFMSASISTIIPAIA